MRNVSTLLAGLARCRHICPGDLWIMCGKGPYCWTHVKAKDRTKSRRGLVITPGEWAEGVAAMAGRQQASDGDKGNEEDNLMVS